MTDRLTQSLNALVISDDIGARHLSVNVGPRSRARDRLFRVVPASIDEVNTQDSSHQGVMENKVSPDVTNYLS